jgi:hypothetical protein
LLLFAEHDLAHWRATIDSPFFATGKEKVPPRTGPALGERKGAEGRRGAGVIGQLLDYHRSVP